VKLQIAAGFEECSFSTKRQKICNYFLNMIVISFFSPFSFLANEVFKKKRRQTKRRTPQNGFAQFLRSSELHRMVSRRPCAVGEVYGDMVAFYLSEKLWKRKKNLVGRKGIKS